MAFSDIAVVLFSAILILSVWNVTSQDPAIKLQCMSQPEGEEYCEVMEGDTAWFDAFVDPEPNAEGNFETTLLWTDRGLHPDSNPNDPEYSNTDDAQPGFDYVPIVIENDGSDQMPELSSIPIEVVDDCDVERSEVFTTILATEPDDLMKYVNVIILDNDDSYSHAQQNYDIMETEGIFEFEVCRDLSGVLGVGEIGYTTVEMTAVDTVELSGFRDFIAKEDTLEFDENEECQTGSVEIISDLNTREETEVFAIDLNFIETSDGGGCTGKVTIPSRAFVTIHDAESILFWIEYSDYSVTEPDPQGESMQFKINIMRRGNTEIQSDIVVSLRGVSATTDADYKLQDVNNQEPGISTTVRFPQNSETEEICIIIECDEIIEEPETFEVSLRKAISGSTSAIAGIIIEPSKAIVTIHDYSTLTSCASFDSSVVVVMESDGYAEIIVRRTGNLETQGTIDIETSDVDASDSTDYNGYSDELEFGIGEDELVVSIRITSDLWKEDTERFKVTLSTPDNDDYAMDVCAPESTYVMITNDDDQFHFGGRYYRVFEDDGLVEIDIIRTGYLGETSYAYVTTAMSSNANSADANDYNIDTLFGNNRIVFGPNEWAKTLEIDIRTNDGYEGEEEFIVMLQAVATSPAVVQEQIGLPDKATVVIYDDFTCRPPCVNGECVNENTCECPPAYTGTLCQRPVRVIGASFTIIEMPPGVPLIFTNDYLNPNSPAYIALEQQAAQQLRRIFSSLDNFVDVDILGFTEGSVVVNYLVQFEAMSDSNLADVSQMFAQAVNNNGLLGDSNFRLSPSDIECPIGYCQNGGTCARTLSSYFCECAEGYSGIQCSTRIFDSSEEEEEEDEDEESELSSGTTIGIVLGVVFLVVLLMVMALGLVWWSRRQRRYQQPAVKPLAPQQAQRPYELRPYNGTNQGYALTDGVLGTLPLY